MAKTTLGQVADIITGPFGSALHQHEYVSFGIPVIMPQDIGNRNLNYEKIVYITQEKANELSRYLVDTNDIVYARRGDIEKHAFITENDKGAICGTGCLRVRIIDKTVNPLFLSFYLNKPEIKKWISLHAVGSSMPNINSEILSKVPIVLPEKREQDSIALFLNSIDNKISNNNTICADLDGVAKLLYNYWFVQFDFPDENGKPYKSSDGKMVWNKELRREIPVGWEVVPYSEVISSINTGLNPRDNFKLNTGGQIKYLTVKNLLPNGNIDFSDCDLIDEEARKIVHKRSDIKIGDILFASISPLGRCHVIWHNPEDWDINESVFSIRPDYNKANSVFLYLSFTSDYFIKLAESNSTGSVFKGIRITELLGLKTILPPKPFLDKFNEYLYKLFDLKSNIMIENQEHSSLRDFLLPMLMNGQVTIKNTEK